MVIRRGRLPAVLRCETCGPPKAGPRAQTGGGLFQRRGVTGATLDKKLVLVAQRQGAFVERKAREAREARVGRTAKEHQGERRANFDVMANLSTEPLEGQETRFERACRMLFEIAGHPLAATDPQWAQQSREANKIILLYMLPGIPREVEQVEGAIQHNVVQWSPGWKPPSIEGEAREVGE